MFMFRFKVLSLTAGVVLALTGAAQAASVYGDPVPNARWDEGRSVGSGLTSTGDSDWSDTSIDWKISLSGATYTYKYTFTNFNSPGLSHVVLDLSDDAIDEDELADEDAITNVSVSDGSYELEFTENSFPHEPNVTGAVKFDDLDPEDNSFTITFDSNRAPVWGDIVTKGGPTSFVYNNAYGSADANVLSDPDNFVARPNGATAVPSPAAASAGFVLLGGLMLSRRRHHRVTRN